MLWGVEAVELRPRRRCILSTAGGGLHGRGPGSRGVSQRAPAAARRRLHAERSPRLHPLLPCRARCRASGPCSAGLQPTSRPPSGPPFTSATRAGRGAEHRADADHPAGRGLGRHRAHRQRGGGRVHHPQRHPGGRAPLAAAALSCVHACMHACWVAECIVRNATQTGTPPHGCRFKARGHGRLALSPASAGQPSDAGCSPRHTQRSAAR